MRAGAARADITPEPGIELAGYAARVQPSTAVHDPLYFHVLYLEEGGASLLWLHADLIGFGADLVERLRTSIGARLGLTADRIVLSASHTHAGPPTVSLFGCGKLCDGDAGYLDQLVLTAADAAVEAREAAVPVSVVEGVATCEIALDRRNRERGMRKDPAVAMGFRRADGDYVAVLANYAVHPVTLNYRNRTISADLTGVAAAHVRDRLPGRPVVLMTNGACGDLNPPEQGGDYEPTYRLGTEVGEAVLRALAGAAEVTGGLSSELIPTEVAVEEMDTAAIHDRAQRVRDAQADANPVWAASSIRAADLWEARMLAQLPLAPMPLALQEVRIAGRRCVLFGAEVLSQMSTDLTRLLGPRTTVVGYANGSAGYLCPTSAFEVGGYEPDLAFIYYGTPKIACGAFEQVVERLSSRSGA